MGIISGWLWIVGALVAVAGTFLPGASHKDIVWVMALSVLVLAYGVGSVTGLIPWERASMRSLALGTVFTIPIVGLAIYLSGGSISYVEPLLFCSLLYAALFFPARWAWPLSVELVVVAGAPLVYEDGATATAFPSRYLALAAAFLVLTGVMVSLKQRLVGAEARQREIANIDPLTGVANRRAFDSALRRELAARVDPRGGRRLGDEEPFALLVFDLDDFKAINDDYGHPVGDEVLRRTARRAESVLRSTDLLARLGGDEFAVIAPGSHGDGADRLGDSLASAISAREPGGAAQTPHASLGVAVFPEDGESFQALMSRADQRLLRAKSRNRRLLSLRRRDADTLRLI
jgi:diguanylate cyclase (GGDEF)-like protein